MEGTALRLAPTMHLELDAHRGAVTDMAFMRVQTTKQLTAVTAGEDGAVKARLRARAAPRACLAPR